MNNSVTFGDLSIGDMFNVTPRRYVKISDHEAICVLSTSSRVPLGEICMFDDDFSVIPLYQAKAKPKEVFKEFINEEEIVQYRKEKGKKKTVKFNNPKNVPIEAELTKLIDNWKKNGFNGVRFETIYMELVDWKDFEGDGRPREEYEETIKDYGIFVAQPNLMGRNVFFESENDYDNRSIDEFGFYDDFYDALKEALGDNININHMHNCYEFEITRIKDASVVS